MGRFTDRDKHEQGIWVDEQNKLYDFHKFVEPSDVLYPAINKLAHYEDLEEQGRLIELPCAVGDTVWDIIRDEARGYGAIREKIVDGIEYRLDGFYIYANEDEWLGKFGELVFLTKEEAERKLKELEGDKE